MEKNLYIDASHPDETRVVLKENGNIEDYEYETVKNNLIKNNIYLGKVSRVEPSLQAAFIDFGRERHGFLSFNDIQSDYYQIPSNDLDIIEFPNNTKYRQIKNTANWQNTYGDYGILKCLFNIYLGENNSNARLSGFCDGKNQDNEKFWLEF